MELLLKYSLSCQAKFYNKDVPDLTHAVIFILYDVIN